MEQVWNKGKVDLIDEFVSSEYVNHTNLNSLPIHGPDGVRQFVTAVRKGFSDLRLVIEDQIAKRDLVVTRYTIEGIHSGEFAGVEATGRPVSISVISQRLTVDGQFREGWTYADTSSLCRQLGVKHIDLGLGE